MFEALFAGARPGVQLPCASTEPNSVIFSALSVTNGAWPRKSCNWPASSFSVVTGNDFAGRPCARARQFRAQHAGFAGVFADEPA